MRRLVKDQLADWICDRCSSLWSDLGVRGFTAKELERMHADFLREQAYKRERYGNRQQGKPMVIKPIKRRGLSDWL